jgi:L-serine/L-threonine ammonia-lyase
MAALHVVTPLLEAPMLSARVGSRVFLKMDTVQPSGSFKVRGIGHLCTRAVAAGATALVTSSGACTWPLPNPCLPFSCCLRHQGGNAGMAVAYCGRRLGVAVTVVIPTTTPSFMVARLRGEGADVRVHGRVWDEAHAHATELVRAAGGAATYVPPFDHPDLWAGHASLVEEVAAQLPAGTPPPRALVCSVGGGGLLCGMLEGLARVGWDTHTHTVAVETEGADCLSAALKAGAPVTLPAITSVAKSLGALTVCARALELAATRPVASVVIPDAAAVRACTAFLGTVPVPWVGHQSVAE